MKICISTLNRDGLQSRVSSHFGRAPHHVIVDSDTGTSEILDRPEGEHGGCMPAHVLIGKGVDVVLCYNIGRGAVNNLERAGIRVMRTQANSVEEALAEQASQKLSAISNDDICAGHDHDHDHEHHDCGHKH